MVHEQARDRQLWRTKLKNNLKAIHNLMVHINELSDVVANQVKEQFESNSQQYGNTFT